ncbi:MAG: PadR family transcriptional regulator [Longimicrobiales bacterium]
MSPHVFHILLSLADRPRHGYGILLDVEARTDGALVLGTGTIYSAIKRLRQLGWIEEVEAPSRSEDDPRRRHYRLTRLGRRELREEAERLQSMVHQARSRAMLPGTSG